MVALLFPTLYTIQNHTPQMTPTNCSGCLFPASQMIMPRKSISAPSMRVVNEYPKSFSCQSLTLSLSRSYIPLWSGRFCPVQMQNFHAYFLVPKVRNYSSFHVMQTIFNRNDGGRGFRWVSFCGVFIKILCTCPVSPVILSWRVSLSLDYKEIGSLIESAQPFPI